MPGPSGDAPHPPPPAPATDPETFGRLDLRVARVIGVEAFPEARHPAWKLTLDLGPLGIRRSSARITNYRPDELLGGLVVAVTNIGSRRIAGFTSEVLVLGAVGADGRVRLLRPDPGARPGDPVA